MSGDSTSGERSADRSPSDDDSDRRQQASAAEKAVLAISIVLTVVLFAYGGWQIVSPPQGPVPEAAITETQPLEDGSVAVTVELRNPTDVGLVTATVQSNCSSTPPQVEFSYVPASSTRTGTLVCPPGTTDPSVSLTNWVNR